MQKVRVTPLIGLPQFDGWAQVVSQSSNQGVWALAVAGQHAGNVGRDIVDLVIDKNFSSAQEVYQFVDELVSQTKDKGCQLSCVSLVATEDKNIFCAYQGSVTLKRQEKLGKLLNANSQIQIIEGDPRPEDLYILATTQAIKFLGEIEQKVSQGFDADTIVTSITPGMRLEEDTACSALAFADRVETFDQEVASAESSSADEETFPELPDTGQQQEAAFSIEISGQPEFEDQAKSEFEPIESGSGSDLSQEGPTQADLTTDLQPELPVATATALIATQQPDDQKRVKKISISTTEIKKALNKVWALLTKIVRLLVKLSKGFSAVLKKYAPVAFAKLKQLGSSLRHRSWLRNPFSRDVYLTSPPTTKILRVLVPLVLIVVVVGSGFFYFSFTRGRQLAQAKEQVEPVLVQLDEAKSQLESNPILARETAQGVVNSLAEIQQTFEGAVGSDSYIKENLIAAEQFLEEISGREEFSELPIFFDAREIESDFVVTQVGLLDDKAVLHDRDKQLLALLDLDSKEVTTASTSEIPRVVDLGFRNVNETVWFLAEGVRQFKPEIQKTITQEIAQGDASEGARFIEPFADSVYLLNPDKRTIYKYPGEDDGFGDPVRWLRSTQGLSLEQVTSFTIDGDIWLTTRQGEVIRLRSGNQQDFSITGLADPFGDSTYLFTTDELEQLYLLDPAKHRLVILTKDGEFLREIKSASLASATGLFVKADQSTAFVTSGSIVYEIAL